MANQAYLESSATLNGNLILNVVIVTADSKIPRQFTFSANASLESIKETIRTYADSVETSDIVAKSLHPGLMDLTPIPPDPEDPPTKEEADRQKFATDVRQLRRMQSAVSLGLLPADDAALAELTDSLKSRFTSEYLDLV